MGGAKYSVHDARQIGVGLQPGERSGLTRPDAPGKGALPGDLGPGRPTGVGSSITMPRCADRVPSGSDA